MARLFKNYYYHFYFFCLHMILHFSTNILYFLLSFKYKLFMCRIPVAKDRLAAELFASHTPGQARWHWILL